MASAKRIAATGAAVAILAAGGVLPAQAAGTVRSTRDSVGSVFSGTIEIASTDGLLVEKKRYKGGPLLIAVDTDRQTVVSQGGLQKSIEDLSAGNEVIVSGTRNGDESILASKIIIRT
jgi:Domain of unknown function (DUF5666)